MSRRDIDPQEVRSTRLIAQLADFLEYACWDYPDDSEQARELVREADEWLKEHREGKR